MGAKSLVILVAEDDQNDVFLLERAFRRVGIDLPVHVCQDGEDTVNYLQGSGRYSDRQKFPFPRVLITDLKMPKLSGFDVLQWLNQHTECKLIPVIVLSSSKNEEDVKKAYQLGANCYFEKPGSLDDLSALVELAYKFWTTCEIPVLLKSC
ncbi:MAG: response regulator [Verrucomicrobiales bacterium]